jgi:thioredoxin 1
MATEILSRALIALAIAGVGVGVYELTNRAVLMRASRKNYLGLENFQPGTPAILYFTTPACVPCKTVQRPAIQAVKQKVEAGVQVIEVDASAQPELANHWGVLSVPTTFIINKSGEPRHVNHGVTRAEKLLKQIEKFA